MTDERVRDALVEALQELFPPPDSYEGVLSAVDRLKRPDRSYAADASAILAHPAVREALALDVTAMLDAVLKSAYLTISYGKSGERPEYVHNGHQLPLAALEGIVDALKKRAKAQP